MIETWQDIAEGSYIRGYLSDTLISVLMILCFFDVVLGFLVAAKERKVTSTIGINGIIRKVVIICSLLFLKLIDNFCEVNIIGWLPEFLMTNLQSTFGISSIGISGIFGIYIIAFELLSILKNWEKATNIRIPQKLKKFLNKISSELQNDKNDSTNLNDIEENFKITTLTQKEDISDEKDKRK